MLLLPDPIDALVDLLQPIAQGVSARSHARHPTPVSEN
jgi:hypothetical protein